LAYHTQIQLFDGGGQRKYVNQSERIRFIKTAKSQQDTVKLFCLLLAFTGARISEVLNLKVRNIDFEEKLLVVESLKKRKTGIYRQIPLPKFLLKALNTYFQTRVNSTEEKIWKWSRRTASRKVKMVMIKSNIYGSQSSSKGLRHGFAINCITQGVPLTLIQKWMGHASISTTAIYLQVVGVEEREFAKKVW
jgi:integrase